MKEIGVYKTALFQDYSFHYDAEQQVALARGPLPDLAEAVRIKAASEKEAIEKLANELGKGVISEPSRTK